MSHPPRQRILGATESRDEPTLPVTDAQPVEDPEGEEEEEEEEESPPAASPGGDPWAAGEPGFPQPEDLKPDKITSREVKKWMLNDVLEVPLELLRWDSSMRWGQIRPLNMTRVGQLYNNLAKELPKHAVRILTREMGHGMIYFYAVAA